MTDAVSFEGFPPETFRERRDRALEAVGGGVLILPAAPVAHRSGDSEYPYRPSSELFYLTGITEPGAVGVFRGGGTEPAFALFVRPRDAKAERWSGPRLGPERAAELYGAEAGHPLDELEARLPGLVAGADSLYYRLEASPRCDRIVLDQLRTARARGSRDGTGPRSVVDPGEILDEMRLRKDPVEIGHIRRAARITVEGFRRAMASTRPGMGEWEVEAVLESTFRRLGARAPAFATIAGSGANGCVLHYVENAGRTEDGDLLLLDGGAEVRLYAGDVSRTYPVSGRFREEQRAVYEVVLRAHRSALQAVMPGAPVAGVHDAAVHALVEGLVELEVLEGGIEELVEAKAHEPYFPHRAFHWLGLDVHDVGDYARRGSSRILEPGMVLTVEPGLYFPPDVDGAPAGFGGIGIRIEDDVLVTEDGMENLTEELPVDPREVESLVGMST